MKFVQHWKGRTFEGRKWAASQEKSDIDTDRTAAVEGGRTVVEWCPYCHLLAQLPRLKI